MRVISMLVLLLLVTGCDTLAGKPASLEEITKVVDALRAAGCTALRELEVDEDGYEVDGATCNDGKSYDMKLDRNFTVVSKRKDYL